MENKYCVYKHTAPNDKVYIGITCQNPLRRWHGGKGYINNTYFYNTILKYGWDNIKHEILYDELSKDEACKKEIELIAYYKSNNSDFGFNHSSGGQYGGFGTHRQHSEETKQKIKSNHRGTRGYHFTKQQKMNISRSKNDTKKSVLCVEQNIVFSSISAAAKYYGVSFANISSCCHGKLKTSAGFHWRFI